jgi:hypothetical protein
MSSDVKDVIPNGDWPYGATRPKEDKETRRRLIEWARRNEVKYSDNGRCLHWLTKGRCGSCVSEHAWMDHVTGWTRNGKPTFLLCQPYELYPHDLKNIIEEAERFGVNVRIHGGGWYGFGTVAIVFSLKKQSTVKLPPDKRIKTARELVAA